MLVIHLNLGTNLTENTTLRQQQIWRQINSMFWCGLTSEVCTYTDCFSWTFTAWEVSIFGVFLVSIFLYLDWIQRIILNTEIYSVNLRIQTERRKIQTMKTLGHFFCSVFLYWKYLRNLLKLQNQSDLRK